tara:strand:+ start:25 stop:471 length:447 start_codon:yes stop_codon:yes gene_type:complete
MFKYIVAFITIIPMISAEKFAAPDNYDFEIKYYNNTICSGKPTVSSKLKGFCPDTKSKDGYPKCCHDNLEKISFSEKTQFQQCYSYVSPNSTHTAVEYNCNLSHYKNISTLEVFGILGLISILLFVITIIYYLLCRVLRRRDHNYVGV